MKKLNRLAATNQLQTFFLHLLREKLCGGNRFRIRARRARQSVTGNRPNRMAGSGWKIIAREIQPQRGDLVGDKSERGAESGHERSLPKNSSQRRQAAGNLELGIIVFHANLATSVDESGLVRQSISSPPRAKT